MVRLEKVSKSFDSAESYAVKELSLTVSAGELLVLLGESGCGKTTTLKMINRLVEPTSGEIFVDGENIKESDPVSLRRRIGYVFQEIGLFPHMTVAENAGAVLKLLERPQLEIDERVDSLLKMLNLPPEDFRHRRPDQLSGGQKQRVGVARALAAQPRLMLMDEPFGALDPITRDGLQREFKKLQNELKLTVIMVTHDVTEALLLADRIAIMQRGNLLAVGSPSELITDKSNPYVSKLMSMPLQQAQGIRDSFTKDGQADE